MRTSLALAPAVKAAVPRRRAGGAHDGPLVAGALLSVVARFGVMTAEQLARAVGRPPERARRAAGRLRRAGLFREVVPFHGPGQRAFLALTPRGRVHLRALRRADADAAASTRAALDHLDEMAAAVDLAAAVEARGAGRWLTWRECLRHEALAPAQRRRVERLGARPVGAVEERDGEWCPVWIVLHPRAGRAFCREVATVCACAPFGPGRLYALPEVAEAIGRLCLPVWVEAWRPPHLAGRPPLLPGWWRGARAESSLCPRIGSQGVAALQHLDRFGHATAAQVARGFGRPAGARVAAPALGRLLRLGLAQRHRRTAAEAYAWSATRAGLALAGSARYPVRGEPAHRQHTLALGDIGPELATRCGGVWETEREVRTSASRSGEHRGLAPPDGRLVLSGRRVAVQLQLTAGRVVAQFVAAHRWRVRGLCDEVWFVCVPAVAAAYRRAWRPVDEGFVRVVEWVAPGDARGGGRRPAGG